MLHQTESSECRLACLAMICGYYGKNIDLIALRRQFNLSSRGTTLGGLIGIAEQLGLATRPLSLDLNALGALKMPSLLHWEFNHFVVLVSVKGNRVVLHAPARGRRTISLTELSHSFTGVVIEAWPGSEFTADSARHQIRLRTLIDSVHGLKGTLGKIFCLSLVFDTINPGDAGRHTAGDGSCHSRRGSRLMVGLTFAPSLLVDKTETGLLLQFCCINDGKLAKVSLPVF